MRKSWPVFKPQNNKGRFEITPFHWTCKLDWEVTLTLDKLIGRYTVEVSRFFMFNITDVIFTLV